MTIGICDDEKQQRNQLRRTIERLLQLMGECYKVDEYESGEELLAGIRTFVPDILFLDIEMTGLNGMEAARELRKNHKETILIFVTAFPDFVFQGYEVQAFHYILKPYKEEKIKEVFEKAVRESDMKKEQYYLIEQKSGIRRLLLKDIIYLKSEGRNIEAVTKEETIRFGGKLSEMEEKLPSYFQRIHNRYLVNLNFVLKLESGSVLCDAGQLPVSRAYKLDTAVSFAKILLN